MLAPSGSWERGAILEVEKRDLVSLPPTAAIG